MMKQRGIVLVYKYEEMLSKTESIHKNESVESEVPLKTSYVSVENNLATFISERGEVSTSV